MMIPTVNEGNLGLCDYKIKLSSGGQTFWKRAGNSEPPHDFPSECSSPKEPLGMELGRNQFFVCWSHILFEDIEFVSRTVRLTGDRNDALKSEILLNQGNQDVLPQETSPLRRTPLATRAARLRISRWTATDCSPDSPI